MVQFYNRQTPSVAESLGRSLVPILQQHTQNLMQKQQDRQQQTQLTQALQEAQQVWSSNAPEEQKIFGLYNALRSNPAMAKQIVSDIQERQKMMQPKAPPGGLTGQPVPPEVANKIEEIIKTNPDANADQLGILMGKSGIAPTYSNSYIESRRRQDETNAKNDLEKNKTSREEAIQFHKESSKFDEKLSGEANAANKKIKAMEQQKKIQTKLSNWDRVVSAVFKGSNLENLLKSSNAQQFDSFALPMVEGQKETFGVRLSDADLRLILQKIATSDKSPEANTAIMDWMILDEKLKIEKRKVADEIKKNNKGLRPLNFESDINAEMNRKFGEEIDSKAQNVLLLPDNETKRREITGRYKVPEGTKLSNEVIDKYLELSNNDPEQASKMAQDDGYQF